MAPIINVTWEHHQIALNRVSLLTSEINRQNTRITANQVTLAEIQQQLADGVNAIGGGGSMGWPLFKGAAYYRFDLPPNVPVKIVEALPEPQLRQLRFRLLTGETTYLSYSQENVGNDHNPLELNRGMLFQDDHDGGGEVWALSTLGATILVEIRTAEQAINEGENFVIPFKAEGIIDARINIHDDVTVGTLKGRDAGDSGWRCLDITSFHPGTEYTINIEVAPTFRPWIVEESTHSSSAGTPQNRYGDKCIEVYAPNLYANLPELALSVILGETTIDPSDDRTYASKFGILKKNGWVASLGKNGGSFRFTPDFSRRHLFMYARISQYTPGDFGVGYAEACNFTWDSTSKTITIVGA